VALPSIGLVTPSFQQGRFLEATLRSVLSQDYAMLQYHVQDGGSSDGSVDILKRYQNILTGWESRRDTGQAQAINLGFARIGAEIMSYLNSDDLLLPGALLAVGDFFTRHPQIDVVYGDRLLINQAGDEIGEWRLPRHQDWILSWADYIPQETLFWRRSAWNAAGGRVDEAFHFAMDWDLILRFRTNGARFHHLQRFLGAFRVHPKQKTGVAMATDGRAEMELLRRRELGFAPTRWQVRLATAPYLFAHMATDLSQRASEVLQRQLSLTRDKFQ
jgi:carbamoyltransferase